MDINKTKKIIINNDDINIPIDKNIKYNNTYVELIGYKIMEMNFSNNISILSTLKPCYIEEDNKIIYTITIPCEKLKICKSIEVHSDIDFNTIPNVSGLYWIMTNEPIIHCLNSGLNCPYINNANMRIIYNGTTDNLRARLKDHLLRSDDKGGSGTQSGISIDVLLNKLEYNKISHIKCLWGEKKKTPKILKDEKFVKLTNKEELISQMYLTEHEKEYIKNNDTIYFKNGINVLSDKHKKYKWHIYFLEIENHNIRDYIEIEWRKKNGVPILCSYTSGR